MQSQDLIFKEYEKAIQASRTLEDLEYVEDKLHTTKKINRRLKINKQLILTVCGDITKKRYELINKGAIPFT